MPSRLIKERKNNMKNEIKNRFKFYINKFKRRVTLPVEVVQELLQDKDDGDVVITVYEGKVVITRGNSR